jgi:hypothetical protein
MGEGETGDCEDFALTKMQALLDAGYDIRYLQLAWGYTETGNAHAVLIVRSSNRGALVLDNRSDEVKEIDRVPYEFESYQRAGQNWSNFTVRLTGVSIVYGTCNAAAFADQDQVIVQFENQSWEQPRVIGFKSNPIACGGDIFFVFGNYGFDPTRIYGVRYSPSQNSYTQTPEYLIKSYRNHACGSPQGGAAAYVMGGRQRQFGDSEEWIWVKHNIEYTFSTTSYAVKNDLLKRKEDIQILSSGSSLYVMCGFGNEEIIYDPFDPVFFYNSNDEYNTISDAWSSKSSHPYAMTKFDTLHLDSDAYMVGGIDRTGGAFNFLSKMIKYDFTLESFSTKPDLPRDSWHSVTSFEDFDTVKGYIVGGDTRPKFDVYSRPTFADDHYLTERCYEYNLITESYTRKQDSINDGYDTYFDVGGWIIDTSTLNTDNEGDGPSEVQGGGGNDLGIVFQNAVPHPAGLFNTIETQHYTPSTDTWELKGLMTAPSVFVDDGASACNL